MKIEVRGEGINEVFKDPIKATKAILTPTKKLKVFPKEYPGRVNIHIILGANPSAKEAVIAYLLRGALQFHQNIEEVSIETPEWLPQDLLNDLESTMEKTVIREATKKDSFGDPILKPRKTVWLVEDYESNMNFYYVVLNPSTKELSLNPQFPGSNLQVIGIVNHKLFVDTDSYWDVTVFDIGKPLNEQWEKTLKLASLDTSSTIITLGEALAGKAPKFAVYNTGGITEIELSTDLRNPDTSVLLRKRLAPKHPKSELELKEELPPTLKKLIGAYLEFVGIDLEEEIINILKDHIRALLVENPHKFIEIKKELASVKGDKRDLDLALWAAFNIRTQKIVVALESKVTIKEGDWNTKRGFYKILEVAITPINYVENKGIFHKDYTVHFSLTLEPRDKTVIVEVQTNDPKELFKYVPEWKQVLALLQA